MTQNRNCYCANTIALRNCLLFFASICEGYQGSVGCCKSKVASLPGWSVKSGFLLSNATQMWLVSHVAGNLQGMRHLRGSRMIFFTGVQ